MTLGRCPLSIFCSRGTPSSLSLPLQNNQRQHRTLHIQKDVLPYALC